MSKTKLWWTFPFVVMNTLIPFIVANVPVNSCSSSFLPESSTNECMNFDSFSNMKLNSNEICRNFHGGNSNWWHYEWCDMKYIRQYTIDNITGEEKNNILLGIYNTKLNKYENGKIPSQLFLNGDMCYNGITNTQIVRNRSTELRFSCCIYQPNEIYIESIIEPRVCDYIVTVCTPKACKNNTKSNDLDTKKLADTVKRMFYHGYNNYMAHAFPMENLKPISCQGEVFELGKIPMLTLIDTLDTLIIFGDKKEFRHAVDLVLKYLNFDIDTEVSVFETTIRVLGGLLSAHLFSIDKNLNIYPNNTYKNGLLDLAIDLGNRLLPAFLTKTGIPYGTVNLRYGVPKDETTIASTAGAGSLSMEFTMLSILTNNSIYANAARTATRGLYFRRSSLGLVGKHIDINNGEWTETTSGPGSNSDSFYEYLFKMYLLYGDTESHDMFYPMYTSLMEHNKHGDWYGDVSMWDGCSFTTSLIFDNLIAFWPGMQILLGDIKNSRNSLNAFYQIWQQYSFLPEQFDISKWKPKKKKLNNYPLRPELIESTYYMHTYTNDMSWLHAGSLFLYSLERYSKTKCGYATIADIETKSQEDKMPSFFLSETCKYLYLLFDQNNFIRNGNYIFTTEAHPFPILPYSMTHSILSLTNEKTYHIPKVAPMRCHIIPFWYDMSFHSNYENAFERHKPRCIMKNNPVQNSMTSPITSSSKLYGGSKLGYFNVEQLVGGFRVHRQDTIESIKVSNLGDSNIVIDIIHSNQHEFRIYNFKDGKMQQCRLLLLDDTISCSAALFGLTRDDSFTVSIQHAPIIYANPDVLGCKDIDISKHHVVVMHRGECFFDVKAKHAENAGAIAGIIINNEINEELMIMGRSTKNEIEDIDDVNIPIVMVPQSADKILQTAFSKGQRVTLQVGTASPTDWPRIEGSQYDFTVWGGDGWGLKLAMKSTKENETPYWTISIAKGITSFKKKDEIPLYDKLAQQLKSIGFSDEKLSLINNDDATIRFDALIDGLRDLGMNDLADTLNKMEDKSE